MIWHPKRSRYDTGLYIFVAALVVSYIVAFWCIYYGDQMSDATENCLAIEDSVQRVDNRDEGIGLFPLHSLGKSPPWEKDLPVIYVITPTNQRLEQKADLTRMSHTLMHVKNLVWILVEDSENKTDLVSRLLLETALSYIHLNIRTPVELQVPPGNHRDSKPRGTEQRNFAIDWLRLNTDSIKTAGVVYFADDDNTYSVKLFEEMRFTKMVSVWPVGLIGGLRYGQPLVKEGKVVGWLAVYKPYRPFAVDMAGFAVNLRLFHENPESGFNKSVEQGFQESSLLNGLQISLDDLEPKANMCSEILVWHTKTVKHSLSPYIDNMIKKYSAIQPYPTLEV